MTSDLIFNAIPVEIFMGLRITVHVHGSWITQHYSTYCLYSDILYGYKHNPYQVTTISASSFHFYSAPVGVRCIVINPSVCPRAYLWNRYTDRHEILCADPL